MGQQSIHLKSTEWLRQQLYDLPTHRDTNGCLDRNPCQQHLSELTPIFSL